MNTNTHALHKNTNNPPYPRSLLSHLMDSWWEDGVSRCNSGVKKKNSSLDGPSAFKHHSPYTRERCVTQWCCQRNQTPFLLHWRRSKSYHHRPLGCPWADSPVCRQNQQRLGLKEKQHEQYCQPTVYAILASEGWRGGASLLPLTSTRWMEKNCSSRE